MTNIQSKIGFFDSGVGGITILAEYIKLFPNTAVEYYADSINCPYGDKTPQQIQQLTIQAVQYLFSRGCTLVVLACNTATAYSVRYIQQEWLPMYYPEHKVLGIIRPVSEYLEEKFILKNEKNLTYIPKIALMATKATVLSGFYQEELNRVGVNNIINLPASGLADAIEKNEEQLIKESISFALKPLAQNLSNGESQPNAIILACTHYPLASQFILEELKHIYSNTQFSIPTLISQSNLVAQKLIQYLANHQQYLPAHGTVTFTTSGDLEFFQQQIKTILENLQVKNEYQVRCRE